MLPVEVSAVLSFGNLGRSADVTGRGTAVALIAVAVAETARCSSP